MPGQTNSALLSSFSEALTNLSVVEKELFCKYGEGPQETPQFPTVIAAFQATAEKHPDLIAATTVREDGSLDSDNKITYRQLNLQANKLAHVLLESGVKASDPVCLYVKRSIEMVVGIIATLKVGACYVPQQVGIAPHSQLKGIADATGAKVVLTTDALADKLPTFSSSTKLVSIDAVMKDGKEAKEPVLSRPVSRSDRCYIIFTSGTTGTPKGVQVTHGNVVNVLLTKPMDLGMGPGVRVSQLLNIAFDMGAWETLGALMHGSTLVIRSRSIADAVKHADVVISTPTVLGTLDSNEMSHVKTVAVAGEPCPHSLAADWARFANFYNSCGPTETTIINTAKLFDEKDKILTIGKPTPNNTVYVLDPETLSPCKIGEVGEMWAGGLCVTAGYLNKPSLTSERYKKDPFIDQEGYFMYKTGDLGRWDDKGELEHYGRADDQVKVRGFRVELDGVSAVAETAPGVTKAVVLKVEGELVAFVTPEYAVESQVKKTVGNKLPYYCVPGRVIALEELPRTGNGKVDKRKLKAIGESLSEAEGQETKDTTRTTTMRTSMVMWTEIWWAVKALVNRLGINVLTWN